MQISQSESPDKLTVIIYNRKGQEPRRATGIYSQCFRHIVSISLYFSLVRKNNTIPELEAKTMCLEVQFLTGT